MIPGISQMRQQSKAPQRNQIVEEEQESFDEDSDELTDSQDDSFFSRSQGHTPKNADLEDQNAPQIKIGTLAY